MNNYFDKVELFYYVTCFHFRIIKYFSKVSTNIKIHKNIAHVIELFHNTPSVSKYNAPFGQRHTTLTIIYTYNMYPKLL